MSVTACVADLAAPVRSHAQRFGGPKQKVCDMLTESLPQIECKAWRCRDIGNSRWVGILCARCQPGP